MTDIEKKIYTSESQLRNVTTFLKAMISDLYKSRHLSLVLMLRNISAHYRQTYLGYVWAILPAIFTTIVFVYLNNKKILTVEELNVPYVVYVLSGMVLWQVFTDSINSPLNQAEQSISMIKKIMFTREAIIVAGVGEVVFNFLIRSILVIIVFFVYDCEVTLNMVFIPFGVLSLIILGTFVGVFLLPLGMLYRDIGKSLTIIITIWFFITPVIYSSSSQNVIGLLKYNPVTPLLVTTRSFLINSNEIYIYPGLLVISVSVVMLIFGWIFFRLSMPHLISRLGS